MVLIISLIWLACLLGMLVSSLFAGWARKGRGGPGICPSCRPA